MTQNDVNMKMLSHQLFLDTSGELGEKAVFINNNLSSLDFNGFDLFGVDFFYCKLDGSNFSNIKINQCTFFKCSCKSGIFTNSELLRVKFVFSNFSDCNFDYTTIVRCNFAGSHLRSVDFSKANIIDSYGNYCALNTLITYNLNITYTETHIFINEHKQTIEEWSNLNKKLPFENKYEIDEWLFIRESVISIVKLLILRTPNNKVQEQESDEHITSFYDDILLVNVK